MIKSMSELYLSYFNEFGTVARFAEYYGFNLAHARLVIEQGRLEHENKVADRRKNRGTK